MGVSPELIHQAALREWMFEEFCSLEDHGTSLEFFGTKLYNRCLYCSLFAIFGDFCQKNNYSCCSEDFFQLVVYTMLFVYFVEDERHMKNAVLVERNVQHQRDSRTKAEIWIFDEGWEAQDNFIFKFIPSHLGSTNTLLALETISQKWSYSGWIRELSGELKSKFQGRLGFSFHSLGELVKAFAWNIQNVYSAFRFKDTDMELVASIVDFFVKVHFVVFTGHTFPCHGDATNFYPGYVAALSLRNFHWRVLKFNNSVVRFFRKNYYRPLKSDFWEEIIPISMSVTRVASSQRIWPINDLPHSLLLSILTCSEKDKRFLIFSPFLEKFLLWSDSSLILEIRLGYRFRVVPLRWEMDDGIFEFSSQFFPERILVSGMDPSVQSELRRTFQVMHELFNDQRTPPELKDVFVNLQES